MDVVFQLSERFPCEVAENGIVTVLEKQNHPIQRLFRKFKVNIPEYKKISLDEYGSYVFRQLDGQKTVREIGQALEAAFGDRVQPLYERLSLFLSHVEQERHYIEKVSFATEDRSETLLVE